MQRPERKSLSKQMGSYHAGALPFRAAPGFGSFEKKKKKVAQLNPLELCLHMEQKPRLRDQASRVLLFQAFCAHAVLPCFCLQQIIIAVPLLFLQLAEGPVSSGASETASTALLGTTAPTIQPLTTGIFSLLLLSLSACSSG